MRLSLKRKFSDADADQIFYFSILTLQLAHSNSRIFLMQKKNSAKMIDADAKYFASASRICNCLIATSYLFHFRLVKMRIFAREWNERQAQKQRVYTS